MMTEEMHDKLVSRCSSFLSRQQDLDMFIITNQGLTIKFDELYTNRVLALSVEISELANEVRSFKHWSKRGRSDKSVLLEEYVDALHFMLSITNDVKIILADQEISVLYHCTEDDIPLGLTNQNINETFMVMQSTICDMLFAFLQEDEEYLATSLDTLWKVFSYLGSILGFSDQEIDVAYDAKYQKNIERQNSGY